MSIIRLHVFRPALRSLVLALVCWTAIVGCNSSKGTEQRSAEPASATSRPTLPTAPAGTSPQAAPEAAPAPVVKASVRIGTWLTQRKEMEFDVKSEALLQQFIREFGDGTVVDKVLVAPAQDGPRAKPTFYLVGMGQHNGQFRAMALPLDQSADDGALYLPPTAARHIAEGSNCVLCYFRFSRGKVTGVDCSESSTGTVERRCEYRTETGNKFFAKK